MPMPVIIHPIITAPQLAPLDISAGKLNTPEAIMEPAAIPTSDQKPTFLLSINNPPFIFILVDYT